MLIRRSVSGYKHLDLGNIKLAFTQVCREEIFRDVYFAANSLYYVESGSARLRTAGEKVTLRKGEVALIRQHSKLDIQKSRDKDGKDFKSIIFYLFPAFVGEFIQQAKAGKGKSTPPSELINLGRHLNLNSFFESLLPLFEARQLNSSNIKEKTFQALNHLSQENKKLLTFLSQNSKPVKIDLYEFMIHIAVNSYSVDELAKLTGRSLSAFKRDFYDIFETTPHQWLLQKKVDYAEQLLRKEKMKPSEIYFMLGFNELSHFSAAFKKIKGFAPSQL